MTYANVTWFYDSTCLLERKQRRLSVYASPETSTSAHFSVLEYNGKDLRESKLRCIG